MKLRGYSIGPHSALTEADLTVANLIGANLIGADLKGVNLIGADLKGANLIGADLKGVNLIGADLKGASLIGANLKWADLKGASLIGAITGYEAGQIQLAREILAILDTGDGLLDMSTWHSCDTSHCLAGWAQHLRPGLFVDPVTAGAMLLPDLAGHFWDDNENAMTALRELATREEISNASE